MSKELKIPGVGRVAFKNPLYREKAGQGVGNVDVMGNGVPVGHLSVQVLRGAEYDENGQYIEGTGYAVPAKELMSFKDRFWANIRGKDTKLDLGTGLVTNVGVMAMANEYAWANPSGSVNTILGLANYHATGTGVTAAAATDIKLQTGDGVTPVAGTQSLVSAANSQSYRSVATIAYAASEAVTEWGLHTSATLSSTTGTPFTATTANSFTATGTPYTASSATVPGQQFQIAVAGTTPAYGLILSNSTSVGNIPAWYNTATGAASATPGATEGLTLRPVLWDHKVFSAINVVAGDSIQFTYTVTINSGG